MSIKYQITGINLFIVSLQFSDSKQIADEDGAGWQSACQQDCPTYDCTFSLIYLKAERGRERVANKSYNRLYPVSLLNFTKLGLTN